MQLGYIGLGKMGQNMTARLAEHEFSVIAHDPDENARTEAEKNSISTAPSLAGLAERLAPRRIIWIMVPHAAVDTVLAELIPLLSEGDIVIDGGNSYYKESMRRGAELSERGIHFLDAGVSGGPSGARNGACIMVGGAREAFAACEPLFSKLSVENGYGYMGASGAGHFVKMVHNGIEYGMMQAIAEGFTVLHDTPEFTLNMNEIARVYNHGSVIESRLMKWAEEGFREYGEDLEPVSGSVRHTGEGKWTVETAKQYGIETPVIEDAFNYRKQSEENPSFTGKILMMLRNRFGGHSIQ